MLLEKLREKREQLKRIDQGITDLNLKLLPIEDQIYKTWQRIQSIIFERAQDQI